MVFDQILTSLMADVLHFLGLVDVVNCTRVCRAWNIAAKHSSVGRDVAMPIYDASPCSTDQHVRKAMRSSGNASHSRDDRPGVLDAMAFVLRGSHRVRRLHMDFGQLAPSSWQRLDRILGACSALQQLHLVNWPAMGQLPSLQGADLAADADAEWVPAHTQLGTVTLESCTVGRGLMAAAASLLQHAHTINLHLIQESKATMGMLWRSKQEPSGVLPLLRLAPALRRLELHACKPLCAVDTHSPLTDTLELLNAGHASLRGVLLDRMHFAGAATGQVASSPQLQRHACSLGLHTLHLSSVPLHRDDLGASLVACKQLRSLVLDKCRFASREPGAAGHGSLLQLLQRQCTSLTHLAMNWCTGTTWRDLHLAKSSAGEQLRVSLLAVGGLVSLSLGGFSAFCTDTPRSLAQAFPHIQTLDISHTQGVTADTLLQCLRGFSRLQALDASNTRLPPAAVQAIRGRLLHDAPPQGTDHTQNDLATAVPHVFVLA